MFRHVSAFDHAILRSALYVLIGAALFLLTTSVAGATDAAATPSAWEYTHETNPVAERRPEASTSADLRLATGLSIAAVIVMATVGLSERAATTAINDEQVIPSPRRPAAVRPIRPAEAMPEAA